MKKFLLLILLLCSVDITAQQTMRVHIYRPSGLIGFFQSLPVKVNGTKYRIRNQHSYLLELQTNVVEFETGGLFKRKITFQESESGTDIYINLKQYVDSHLGYSWRIENQSKAQQRIARIERKRKTIRL